MLSSSVPAPPGWPRRSRWPKGGAKVVVFEKQRSLGGTSNFFQGTFAVESDMQRERYVDYTRDQAFKNTMDYSHWRANPAAGEGDRQRVRPDHQLAAGTGRGLHRRHHQHARLAPHLSRHQGQRRGGGQGSGRPGQEQGRRRSFPARRWSRSLKEGGRISGVIVDDRRRRGRGGGQGGRRRQRRLRQQQGVDQEVHGLRPRRRT